MSKKKILVLYPRSGDYTHLQALNASGKYEFVYDTFSLDPIVRQGYKPDSTFGQDYTQKLLDKIAQTEQYDGVIGTHDYPANLTAALYAEKWKLPYPSVKSILNCQHKFHNRTITSATVPEATPSFQIFDPRLGNIESLTYPVFIKPIKSSFSRHAHTVHSEQEFKKLCCQTFFDPGYLHFFNEIFTQYTGIDCDANLILCEGVLHGHQVSIEGYVYNNQVVILGIVDAHFHNGTLSFECFSYPSTLPTAIQKRMAIITQKAITALELNNTLFSCEMVYNSEEDRISIIEINPRISSQFADFFEQVHGLNSYEILLALTLGQQPPQLTNGSYSHAASFPLRLFKDHIVTRVPSPEDIDACKRAFPEALITCLPKVDQRLSELQQDGNSYLYALINLAANSFKELEEKRDQCKALLPFNFMPVSKK